MKRNLKQEEAEEVETHTHTKKKEKAEVVKIKAGTSRRWIRQRKEESRDEVKLEA